MSSMSAPCVHYEVAMQLTCSLMSSIQFTSACSRPMTSHHVMCHVNAVTCCFIINKIQKKRNIKPRKIDKRKRKMLVLMCIITLNTCLTSQFLSCFTLLQFPFSNYNHYDMQRCNTQAEAKVILDLHPYITYEVSMLYLIFWNFLIDCFLFWV